jgi:hypothetical protein
VQGLYGLKLNFPSIVSSPACKEDAAVVFATAINNIYTPSWRLQPLQQHAGLRQGLQALLALKVPWPFQAAAPADAQAAVILSLNALHCRT